MVPWILAVLLLYVLQSFMGVGIRVLMSGNSPAQNMSYGLGSRDEPPPMPVVGARADRAFKNMQESLPVFLTVALLVEMKGTIDPIAVYGAIFYLVMRTIYVPSYLSGVMGIRSTTWTLAWVGILAMGSTLFF